MPITLDIDEKCDKCERAGIGIYEYSSGEIMFLCYEHFSEAKEDDDANNS